MTANLNSLSRDRQRDFLERGFTRRNFGRLATMLTAGAALPFYNEPALAQLSMLKGDISPDAVRINANENPMGPCPEAADAIYNVVKKGGRYMWEETGNLQKLLAAQEELKPENVLPFAGSSAPLHYTVLAFASPHKSFVVADPGYEAGSRAAEFIGAKVIKVPLTRDYSHDVRAMANADPNAGVIYLCNPNNPSGTLTSRADIDYLVAHKPAGSVILLDEAYIHFSGAPTASDLVASGKDVIVLRTFSKLYGMAGLRAGAAMARPDLLDKIAGYHAGALPVTGMVGAIASLKSPNVIAERRKIVKDTREDVFAFLDKHKIKYIPSISNKFMLDTGRPGGQIVDAMAAQNVYIGRVWPVWPTYVRVTVGTRDDMVKFKTALLKVLA